MLGTRLIIPLAFASVAFLWGCQEQASSPTGPEGPGPLFTHKEGQEHGKKGGGGCGGGGGEDPTVTPWSKAYARVHKQPSFVLASTNTLQSNIIFADTDPEFKYNSVPADCFGFPGAKTSNPTVEWNDQPDGGETEGIMTGCAQVTTTGTEAPVRLTNDAYLIVGTKKGSTKFTIQLQIQNVGGAGGIQYRTDKFVIDAGAAFTGADFTLHVDTLVQIWRLKGHTGGPKVASAGDIYIGDIVYE